jgi:hypothetical protein
LIVATFPFSLFIFPPSGIGWHSHPVKNMCKNNFPYCFYLSFSSEQT